MEAHVEIRIWGRPTAQVSSHVYPHIDPCIDPYGGPYRDPYDPCRDPCIEPYIDGPDAIRVLCPGNLFVQERSSAGKLLGRAEVWPLGRSSLPARWGPPCARGGREGHGRMREKNREKLWMFLEVRAGRVVGHTRFGRLGPSTGEGPAGQNGQSTANTSPGTSEARHLRELLETQR